LSRLCSGLYQKEIAMPDRDVGDGNGRSTDRLLGELIAEVRAVKHNQNNASSKLDAVGHLVETVREMKEEQEKHHFRIAVLEADKNRREGAIGLFEWLARHWPISLIVAALAAWVAWANNKVTL
jgi:hypothetical protein